KTLRETVDDSTLTRYEDMPEIVSIPAGKYTIEAFNGEQKSGFDSPYYYGSKDIEIGIQEFTDAQVVCRLACVKVSVEFTDLFLNNVEDAVCLICTHDGVNLQFDETEARAGYIAVPADSVLEVHVRGYYVEDGTEVRVMYPIKPVASQQWHKIALSVNTQAGIKTEGMLLVDHTINEKESTVVVPGANGVIDNNGDQGSWDDEPEPELPTPPTPSEDEQLPTIIGSNFNGKTFDVAKVLELDDTQDVVLDVTLTATNGGIEHLYLSMTSTNAELNSIFSVGLAATEETPWDLCDINSMNDEAQEAVIGFNIVDSANPIRGKEHFVFSIGGFMSFLSGNADHSFKITVVDAHGGKTTQTLVIRTKE
ncbi:MAG: DUF4493 domain-containing protein, partial [Odoribacter sp.]|nr:DUF4493 domain-containing protein [Odoribacter sp.]